MTKRTGVGQFLSWDGGCLFIGHHDRPLPVHAHQAIQLVAAGEGSHLVRAGEDAPWEAFSVAAVASRQPHGIDVTDSDYGAVIFIEPETLEGRALTQRFGTRGVIEVGDAEARAGANAIFTAWLAGRGDETVAKARHLVATLSTGVHPSRVTDERILRAIAYIGAHLDRSITLDEVAAHACLSPSRFRHLFVEQTSMGLRPYILWRRFLLVWELLMKGGTLSEAAHAAGFADAAHLSRTSVRTFGFAPSALQLGQALPDASRFPPRSPRTA